MDVNAIIEEVLDLSYEQKLILLAQLKSLLDAEAAEN